MLGGDDHDFIAAQWADFKSKFTKLYGGAQGRRVEIISYKNCNCALISLLYKPSSMSVAGMTIRNKEPWCLGIYFSSGSRFCLMIYF